MGYECPVCGAETADGEHLANHVAFTALVRGGDHEAFLDEHVPDWGERDPESLAADLTDHAAETDAEPVTEPRHAGHDHGHGRDVPAMERAGRADLSGEAASILEEARELTEAMQASSVTASGQSADAEGDDADDDREGADAANADGSGEAADDDSESE
ncbi:DUF5810 domain-containing protein [Halobacterium yunchengense]|uniref:DUF5810 domain-containing protein n=1 Tax=Halobacterium yunchengense TaxID=3108497 RepID=UPI00300AEFF4